MTFIKRLLDCFAGRLVSKSLLDDSNAKLQEHVEAMAVLAVKAKHLRGQIEQHRNRIQQLHGKLKGEDVRVRIVKSARGLFRFSVVLAADGKTMFQGVTSYRTRGKAQEYAHFACRSQNILKFVDAEPRPRKKKT